MKELNCNDTCMFALKSNYEVFLLESLQKKKKKKEKKMSWQLVQRLTSKGGFGYGTCTAWHQNFMVLLTSQGAIYQFEVFHFCLTVIPLKV